MEPNSKGLVYFKDGHTEDILETYHHEHPGLLSVVAKSGIYVRVIQDEGYIYYKSRVNKDWEKTYTRVNNIDHVELK